MSFFSDKVESALQQRESCFDADARIRTVLRTFNEVQSGSNPLTDDEVARLVELRPHVYGCLRGWVEKRRG